MHPFACEAFNADFDGDQMAVYLPLSDEAQKEAREIMLSSLNLLRPSNGMPVMGPFRDIALGCYFLTRLPSSTDKKETKYYSSNSEAVMAFEQGYFRGCKCAGAGAGWEIVGQRVYGSATWAGGGGEWGYD